MEIVLGQYRGELVLLGEATSHQPVAVGAANDLDDDVPF